MVTTDLVMKIVEPIWESKNETAARVRSRIELVLAWATVRGYRSGDNPARWRSHLDQLLSKRSKGKNFESMPYAEIPAYAAALRDKDSVSAQALEFTILTAVRTTETRLAKWSEIDFEAKVWKIPANRPGRKVDLELRVPLSDRVLEILQLRKAVNPESEFVFCNQKGQAISNNTMRKLLQSTHPNLDVHGFRGSFKTWGFEKTDFSNLLVEMSLGHTVKNTVEKAYLRGDALEKRKDVMQAWTDHCMGRDPRFAEVILLKAQPGLQIVRDEQRVNIG